MKGTFRQRRLIQGSLLLALVGLLILSCRILDEAMRPTAIYTGLLLLLVLLGLTLFNARKKLPFLPLLKVSTWTQWHLFTGFFSVALFLLHTGLRFPNGLLESVLAGLFTVVALSGFVGLFLSRWLPSRLTRSGEPLTYERLPAHRRTLIEEAETVVRRAESETGSSAIGDFYLATLAPYLQGSPGLAILLGNPQRYERAMLARTDEFGRYLSERERPHFELLRECVRRKGLLDYQGAAQGVLKGWLCIHIPCTYGLLVLALVHGWVALTYGGRL